MRLEQRALADAAGCVLAHAVPLRRGRLPKGRRLDATTIERLRASDVDEVEVAVPEAGDVAEDDAARRCALALLKPDAGLAADVASTGRVNLRAATDGLLLADRGTVDALNAIDPRLTVATLEDTTRAVAGDLVATAKVIPFYVPDRSVARWEKRAAEARSLRIAPWRARRVAHISTVLEGTKPSVLDKTRRALLARLDGTGAAAAPERRTPHARDPLTSALATERDGLERTDVIVVFGASAVTDEADVVPAAIRLAGGRVHRVGMPVDPGNLLVWGELDGAIVLGAPGCARSAARNGFDWALDRALAGVRDVRAIARLGVGGLLKEIPSRPQPREST